MHIMSVVVILPLFTLQPGGSSGSIQVKWADPDLQHKKKKALDESNADNRMVSNTSARSMGWQQRRTQARVLSAVMCQATQSRALQRQAVWLFCCWPRWLQHAQSVLVQEPTVCPSLPAAAVLRQSAEVSH
jgi:hypothetical protein